MMTIETNRALAFLAALETLQKNITQVIENLRLCIEAEDLGEDEYEQRRNKIGSEPDVLNTFDDALDDLAVERNRYVEHVELGLDQMNISWKPTK